MNPDHLLELAEQMVRTGAGYPRQAVVNRAISTAYYALFHALAGECVAQLVGSPRSPRHWSIVTPIHRSIEHGATRKVFDRLANDRAASSALKLISEAFLDLQSARNAADYDPSCRYSRQNALDLIGQARGAIGALRSMPKDDRLLLAVQLVTKPR